MFDEWSEGITWVIMGSSLLGYFGTGLYIIFRIYRE